jgi:hypothetical protein
MTTTTRISTAERLGRWLGGMWRGGARLDRKANGWLRAQGLAPSVAKTLLLAVKLAVLGVLLYTVFWLTVLIALVALAAWGMSNSTARDTEDESTPEWRDGHGGFGLYDKNEWRHDMGDPDKQ